MNSTLWIVVFIVALIFSVGFLLLVLSLVPAINQLKVLLRDLEKTSMEARSLVSELKATGVKVNDEIEKVDHLIDSARESVGMMKESLRFLNKNVLKQSAGLLAVVSAAKYGWNLIRKFRGKKD